VTDNLCPECGANPCYGICPLNDPYGGDQAAENADYEFNARYDSVSERYMEHCPKHGPYAGDCGGCEAEHYEAMDGNDDDYSEVATSTAVLYSVDDFIAPLAPSETDDIPF
jgi:hypothetical protein